MRRAIAIFLAVIVLLGPNAPALAQSKTDFELTSVLRRAQELLGQLEYQRAREVLEEAARDAKYKKARPMLRAKLFAELGRARAELGDAAGMDEAFVQAVAIDREVRLARTTSPKILAALERVRANAPPAEVVESEEQEDEPDSGAAKTKAPKRDAGAKAAVKRDAGGAVSAGARADASASARADASTRADAGASVDAGAGAIAAAGSRDVSLSAAKDAGAGSVAKADAGVGAGASAAAKADAATGADAAAIASADAGAKTDAAPAIVEKPKATKPSVNAFVQGSLMSMTKARVVVTYEALPPKTKVVARMRKAGTLRFEPLPLTESGTVSIAEIRLELPRYEVFVEARKGKQLIARAFTEDAPLVIETKPLPTLADAWSEPPKPTDPPLTEPVIDPVAANTNTTTTATTTAVVMNDELIPGSGITEEEGLIIGASVVGAALITVLIIVLVSSGGSGCDAAEGFGCTEIRILP